MFRNRFVPSGLRISAAFWLVVITLAATFTLSGCGGSSKPISVAVTASATTVDGTDTVTLTATVTNDKSPGGVSWTVTGGGTLSNTTTSSATYTAPAATSSAQSATITATSIANTAQTATATISVPATPAITTAALGAANVGASYSQTLTASGGIAPYTWSLASGTLPTCLTITQSASGAAITGTPNASCAGSYTVTFKVTDSGTPTALTATTQALTLTISPAPAITFTGVVPATATYNVAYAGSAAATGGAGALSYSVATGALPAGLTLNAGTGAITGIPTTGGTFAFSIKAADAFGDSNTQAYSIVTTYPAIVVTPATLPTGYVGSVYTQSTLAATGGSGTGYSFALATGSSLPVGLSLSTGGAITGKPTGTTGTTSFTVKVTDSASNTGTGTFSITVNAGVSITTPTTLPIGYVAGNYSQTLAATGGSGTGYTWAVSSGSSLPAGLTLSAAGVLSGKPTAAGSPSFGITVTDSVQNTASATFSMTIAAGVTITTPATLPGGYQGAAYPGATLAAVGGTGTGYTWAWAAASGSALPTGLNLSAGGAISGTPTAAGTFSVVITATDSAQNTASSTFSLTVESTVTVTTTSPLKSGTINAAYSQSLGASGGSGTGYTWSTNTAGTTALAAINLTLTPAGLVAGTPLSTGSATFTATVTDSQSHTGTATLSVTVYASLTVTTTTLPATNVGSAYSQTLAAAGGTGSGYTWTASSSNLATYGLSLSTAGVISGTPTTAGTASFTATVTDSGSNTANAPLTITIYSGLSLPTPDPSSLPGTATTGVAYSGSISGSGGSGNYCYTVTSLPSDNLSSPAPNSACGYVASSVPVSGTPASAQTVTFSVKLTDTTTNASITQTGYNIVVSNPAALTLPNPNPSSLPSATVNQSYSGQINSAGGVGPNYTWTVNSVAIPTNGTSVAESDGISVSSTGGPTLFVSGTPTSTGSVPLSVSVTDSASHTAGPDAYTVAVNSAGSQVSGQINLTTGCSGPGNYPPMTVSINTNPVQTTTTDSNGNYSFGTVPNGTYTITPSITGAESIFFPASYTNVVVNNGTISGENFSATLGYTISGAVSYAGSSTGHIFVLLNSGCGGGGGGGTSITAPGSFTIRGVPPGNYTVQAWMDTIGQDASNALDPSGSASTTVTSNNVTGVDVTMTDPTVSIPTSGPKFNNIIPNAGGVDIQFNPIKNSNGLEEVSSYTVEWSTDPAFGSGSTYSFKAIGKGSDVWILNNGLANMTGSFTSGTAYYFRAQGKNSAGPGPWAVYGSPTAVTIGALSTGNTVTGTVTIPSSITPTGPLYVGFYDQATGAVYGVKIASPSNSTPNAYTVLVPTDANPDYQMFGILDQNNDGLIDAGDVSNTDNHSIGIAITGNLSNQNTTLPTGNSSLAVTTQFQQITCSGCGSTFTNYNVSFNLRAGNKLPVAATITSGPNVINPVDLGLCDTCGNPQFQDYFNIASAVPTVGDSYGLLVTYSDGTSETVTGTVTAVLNTSQLATGLSPSGPSSGSTTPDFTWTYPANASNYLYSFYLSGNSGTIWQIPGNNSNANGFTSAQIPVPAGIQFPTDPTDNSNSPSVGSLTSGDTYNWQIQTQDTNGNQAQTQIYFVVP